LDGIDFCTFPASTIKSSGFKFSIFLNNSFKLQLSICGPAAFISVSSLDLSFIFILVSSLTCIKSVRIPESLRESSINLPVNPPMNPNALLDVLRLLRTLDTFIPFPPAYFFSFTTLFMEPKIKLSVCIT